VFHLWKGKRLLCSFQIYLPHWSLTPVPLPPWIPLLQVIGNKYETYVGKIASGTEPATAMNELGLKRYCCRRMVLTHVNLIDKLLAYHSFTRKAKVEF